MSAIVEPIFAVLGAVAVTFFTPILPYALAFAAGAMIFVVVEEVIPETQLDKYTDIAAIETTLQEAQTGCCGKYFPSLQKTKRE